jgi:hypothetical protein
MTGGARAERWCCGGARRLLWEVEDFEKKKRFDSGVNFAGNGKTARVPVALPRVDWITCHRGRWGAHAVRGVWVGGKTQDGRGISRPYRAQGCFSHETERNGDVMTLQGFI